MVTDVDLHSQHLLLDIISPISFDYNFDLLTKSREVITGSEARFAESPMLEAYHRSAEIMGEVFITPLPLLKLGAKLGVGRLRELTAAYDDLEKMGDDIVKRRRACTRAPSTRAARSSRCASWTRCCSWRTRDGERAYTDEELWGDMNDIMAAGHQTQAATMTMALLYVSRDADVKAKIEAEVRALGGAPTFEDVSEGRLSYTQNVIKETLRLHPPIHMFPRLASESGRDAHGAHCGEGRSHLAQHVGDGTKPATCGRIRRRSTPSGSRTRAWSARARSQAEEDANEEEIERAVTMLKSGRDFIYTPFGAGPRSCIGGLFSLLTVTTIVASIVQKFDVTPDDATCPADADIPLRYDVTMCYPDGINMKLRRAPSRRGARGEPAPPARAGETSSRAREDERRRRAFFHLYHDFFLSVDARVVRPPVRRYSFIHRTRDTRSLSPSLSLSPLSLSIFARIRAWSTPGTPT